MSNITFAEIMEFYPEHNRSVYEDLMKDYQRGCLLPFVGAGLCVFCGYLQWPSVLKRLAKFVFSEDKRSEIEAMIAADQLLQAAQEIHDHYPRMLKELQKIISYEKIQHCDTQKLYASAVYVLPYLFGESLVMTTNFDRVLEEVYERHHAKFGKIVTPYDPDLLTQIRQKNPHCLFKLHGDIGPEIHDAEKLVFTKTQYDKAYAANGPLMQELPLWFQNRKLLFLGCSLAMDRTMEILQTVTAKNSELDHYAILACKPEDRGRRTVEMGRLGISPIYYPDGKHDAVRVILERLLEQVNYAAYEELSRRTGKSAPASGPERRFMYDSDYIAFTGRDEELKQLHSFCLSPEPISWWGVTGPGGMGKSRLVHEFVKARKNDGWEIYWLKHDNYANLPHWTPPVDPCIVVADDVQAHFQTIGDWIVSISTRQRSEKLRVLLLERDGKDLSSAKWAELMQSDSPYDNTIQSRCYRSDFLQLNPLSADELKTIMENFAAASGKPLTDTGHADRLLQALQKIDGDLQRPIYALAIADAWCSGKDPSRWDKEQVLDTLVTREMDFYYKRLQNTSEKKITKQMRTEFETLLARSCLTSFLPLEQISGEEYPKLHKRANELDIDFPELLRLMGVVHRLRIRFKVMEGESEHQVVRTESIEAVLLDCPDLVKEYLVLRQAFDKGQPHLLLPDNWDNDPLQLMFLRRILLDYPEKLEGHESFWNKFFAGDPKEALSAWIYSDLLFGVTVTLSKMEKPSIERLERLHEQFSTDKDIAVKYAKALVNLAADQKLEDCMQSIQKLEALHQRFPGEKTATVYASGLFNLTINQELEDAVQIVHQLELLHKQFPDSMEIAAIYAQGLVNLTADQASEDCVHSVYALELLSEQFQSSEKIAVQYARGLYNLTAKQISGACVQSIHKLDLLHRRFLTNTEIAVEYADGLFNSTIDQSLETCTQSIYQLERLREQFPADQKIALSYAVTLVNLSFEQTSEADVQETLKKAKNLLAQYPEDTAMQLSYAQTYFNLTLQQSPGDLERTVAKLREYLLAHPKASKSFQDELDKYLSKHPDHTQRYTSLRV